LFERFATSGRALSTERCTSGTADCITEAVAEKRPESAPESRPALGCGGR
jgi:hypothetical protein